MRDLTIQEVRDEIAVAERELNQIDQRALRLWERIKISPQAWASTQYPGIASAWVIAICGERCMYYNAVERGWGWGRYSVHGTLRDFHSQQDEIHHVVLHTTFALLEGGAG